MKKLLVFIIFVLSAALQERVFAETPDLSAKLTDKQSKELSRFQRKELLINPLIKTSNALNRFDKNTLYVMNNFKIVQKIPGGYLISPNTDGSMEFNVAFLKTTKKFPSDLLITGVVHYSGDYKYTGFNGFERNAALLKIPAGLPLMGRRNDGISDPFKLDPY